MKMITREEYSEIVNRGISPQPLPIQNWVRFAEACYDMNTVHELIRALQLPADPYDCREWGISKREWRKAIKAALAAKAYAYDRM
jgi:hypothetical protein